MLSELHNRTPAQRGGRTGQGGGYRATPLANHEGIAACDLDSESRMSRSGTQSAAAATYGRQDCRYHPPRAPRTCGDTYVFARPRPWALAFFRMKERFVSIYKKKYRSRLFETSRLLWLFIARPRVRARQLHNYHTSVNNEKTNILPTPPPTRTMCT